MGGASDPGSDGRETASGPTRRDETPLADGGTGTARSVGDYSEPVDEASLAGYGSEVRRKAVGYSAVLAALLVAVVVGSATVGPVSLSPVVVAKAALNTLSVPVSVDVGVGTAFGLPVPTVTTRSVHPVSFAVADTAQVIVETVRLPRIVLGAVVGFALAAAGTVMQGFFRNPMADPSIVGVSSGAAVGAVAVITLGSLPVGLQTAAFAGAVLTAFAVYAIATQNGRTPVATLLLAGVAVQTFLGAVTSYLLVTSGESLRQAIYWLMGHLHTSSWGQVGLAAPPVLVGTAVLLAYARDLNVLVLGEEEAATLGIEVVRTKRILLAAASVVTAAAVAVAGVIGFVGLVVPHMVRLVVGPDHRVLLPTSALAGASFLVLTDTVARSGAAELPVGIVTAALGAPFFLYLLRKREVHGP